MSMCTILRMRILESILFSNRRSRIGERFEDLRRSLPDVAETLGQNLHISVPQLDVVGSRRTSCESNGMADNERCGFRFGFADAFARCCPTVATVKKLVRQLMGESGKLLGRRLAGKKGYAAAVGRSAGRCDVLGILDGDALLRCKALQLVDVGARVTFNNTDLRQFLAIGLTVKDIRGAESGDAARRFFAFVFVVRFAPDDRSENQDALLALLDEAPEFVPRAKPGDIAGVGLLRSDQQDVVQAVAMESPDGRQLRRQHFAAARLQGGNKLLGCAVCNFLDLFCFHFRSPVRGFGSLTSRRGTKGPRWQENGRRRNGQATGVTPGQGGAMVCPRKGENK
jgi:hypothetical protein